MPDAIWRELFNSDAALYGGAAGFSNFGGDLPTAVASLRLRPAGGAIRRAV